jgi:putative DNA primase/helicase
MTSDDPNDVGQKGGPEAVVLDFDGGVDIEHDDAPLFSDEYIALRFAHLHQRDLRYVAMRGQWMSWNGTTWARDEILRAFDRARKLCRIVASETNKSRESKAIASAKTVAAVERLARADPKLSTAVEQWDDKPDQFNTPSKMERTS